MNLEIVSHCWHYSRPLIYQISSLFLNPPRDVQVLFTVFADPDDVHTRSVLDFFRREPQPSTIALRTWFLPRELLTRRLTGRNMAALNTKADWIWFADCDYVWGPGCLDALPAMTETTNSPLIFPGTVNQNTTHRLGDETLQAAAGEPKLLDIVRERFTPRRMRRAIGGIQIARGSVVREIGYCKDAPSQGLASGHWVPTREDVWFRQSLGTAGRPVALPEVFRIRHSERGGKLLDAG